jgi:hypothetical protein
MLYLLQMVRKNIGNIWNRTGIKGSFPSLYIHAKSHVCFYKSNRQTSPRLDHLHKSWDTILDSKVVQNTFT